MQFSEELLLTVLHERDQRRTSYAALAEKHLGDRTLGDQLRAAMRAFKHRTTVHTILDPVGKLFGDAVVAPHEPTLVISDTHCPYQNKAVLMAAFDMAKQRGIQQLVHAGDVIDAASYNNQAKGEVVTSIETDITHARSVLYTASAYFKRIIMIPGNHDFYYTKKADLSFDRFIKERVLENKYTAKFHTTEFDYIYLGTTAVIGHLSSGYDMQPGKVAATIAKKYNMHALVGHDHLRGFVRNDDGTVGISIGAMFVPGSFWYKERSYNTFPNTQVGFCIIEDGHIWQYDDKLNEVQIV